MVWRSIFTGVILLSWISAALPQASGIRTNAEYAVIMDYETGEVLFSHNGSELMTPASMTKIMTAYVVFDRLKRKEIFLEDKFITSENAWRKGGFSSGSSTMGLEPGDKPTVEELLRGLIVLSGNDACIVLAEALSGSEELFAHDMTLLAQELGLKSANFVDATGLSSTDQVISAEDLAKLTRLTIKEFPEYYKLYAEKSFSWRGIRQTNRNPLLGSMRGADGLKTGFLSKSKYGLAASAVRHGQRRILVLNGMETLAARKQESLRLMRLAFTAFDTKKINPDSIALPFLPVWLGEKRQIAIRVTDSMQVSGHKRLLGSAKLEIVLPEPLIAPVEKGTVVGKIVVSIGGVEKASADVVTMEGTERIGFLGRIVEGLRLLALDRDN